MPTFSKEHVESAAARKARRDVQPVKEPGELLAVFVPGKLVNTKNARLHWAQESRYKRRWRDSVALYLLEHGRYSHHITANLPKVISFTAFVHNEMDGDGLQVSLAPIRDALIECRVIHGDADRHGHTFTYAQQIDRKNRGVTIRVRLKGDA